MTEPATIATDREVCSRAQTALSSSPVYGLRELVVEHTGEALVISGTVTSFYHKQLAQEIVLAIVGRGAVINQVEVRPNPTNGIDE